MTTTKQNPKKFEYPEKSLKTYTRLFDDIGWVIPLAQWNADWVGNEKNKGKAPAAPYKDRTEPFSFEELNKHRKQGKNFGLVNTNGLLIVDVDVDGDKQGEYSLTKLEHRTGIDFREAFPYVETPSGGLHFYVRIPPELKLTRNYKDYPDVDFQMGNRLIVLPQSKHRNGGIYKWGKKPDVKNEPFPLAPTPVLDEFEKMNAPIYKKNTGKRTQGRGKYSKKDLRQLLQTIGRNIEVDKKLDYLNLLWAAKDMTCKEPSDEGGLKVVIKYLEALGYPADQPLEEENQTGDYKTYGEETEYRWYNDHGMNGNPDDTTCAHLFALADKVDGGETKNKINSQYFGESDVNDDFAPVKKTKVKTQVSEEFRDEWEEAIEETKKHDDAKARYDALLKTICGEIQGFIIEDGEENRVSDYVIVLNSGIMETYCRKLVVALVQANMISSNTVLDSLSNTLYSAAKRRDKTLSKNDDRITKADIKKWLKELKGELVQGSYIDSLIAADFIDYMFDPEQGNKPFMYEKAKRCAHFHNGQFWVASPDAEEIEGDLQNYIDTYKQGLGIDASATTNRVSRFLSLNQSVSRQFPHGEVNPFDMANDKRDDIHTTLNKTIIFNKDGTYDVVENDAKHYQFGGSEFEYVHYDDDEPLPCPAFFQWFDDSFSGYSKEEKEDIKLWFQEFMCYCLLYTRNDSVVVLKGAGRDGKSVFLDIMMSLIGKSLSCNLQTNHVGGEHALENLPNSKLLRFNEGEGVLIDNFKLFSGNAVIPINPKGVRMYDAYCFGQVLIATNGEIKVNRVDPANRSRLVVIPFRNKIDEKFALEREKELGNQSLTKYITENELPAIFAWALRGYKRLSERGFRISGERGILPKVLERERDHVLNQSTFFNEFISEYFIECPVNYDAPKKQRGRTDIVEFHFIGAAFSTWCNVQHNRVDLKAPNATGMESIFTHQGYGWVSRHGQFNIHAVTGAIFNIDKFLKDISYQLMKDNTNLLPDPNDDWGKFRDGALTIFMGDMENNRTLYLKDRLLDNFLSNMPPELREPVDGECDEDFDEDFDEDDSVFDFLN